MVVSRLRLLIRLSLVSLLWLGAGWGRAAEPVSTTRFLLAAGVPPVLEADAQKNDPETPIVAPIDYFREGDEFLVKTTAAVSGVDAWVKVVHEWAEPITAPDGTAPQVDPAQMQLVEVKGKVTIESEDKAPLLVKDGQELPGGVTLVTGPESAVAVFIGGINSVRVGPQSRVAITYQVVGPFRLPGVEKPMQRRITRVTLKEGRVFCKIGYEPQVEQYFQLTSDAASAVASSGDFVVMADKDRFEIGVARGVVRLVDAKSSDLATLTANRQSGFQIWHLPEAKGQLQMMTANSRFLEETLDFINLINHKIRALRQRHEGGENLTKQERDYLDRLPTISFLRRVRKS